MPKSNWASLTVFLAWLFTACVLAGSERNDSKARLPQPAAARPMDDARDAVGEPAAPSAAPPNGIRLPFGVFGEERMEGAEDAKRRAEALRFRSFVQVGSAVWGLISLILLGPAVASLGRTSARRLRAVKK